MKLVSRIRLAIAVALAKTVTGIVQGLRLGAARGHWFTLMGKINETL